MHFDTPALVFIGTAMAIGAVCLSYLKARFHTTDHHLMVFVVVLAIGYLAPMHIERAALLERERVKETWAGTGRTFGHELERAHLPLKEMDTNVLQRTLSHVCDRLGLSSADLSVATLVTKRENQSYKRITVSLGLAGVPEAQVAEGCDAKIAQALNDQELWCEEKDERGKTRSIHFLVPLRNLSNEVEGVLMVQYSARHWVERYTMAEWRVVGEFVGLLSICVLMLGFIINTAEARRRRDMEKAVGTLKAKVDSLGGMVNAVHGVVWERPGTTKRFTFVSQQADGFLGYTLQEWTSERGFLEDVIFEEDQARAEGAWRKAVETSGIYEVEYRVRKANGGVAHVSEHGQATKLPMQGVVLRGIMVDITAQREAEAAVQDMHKLMVEASRQSGMAEIATGVLHNVGNVLNSLNVGAKLLLERMQRSRLDRLVQATTLLKENLPNKMDFFTEDKRGKALPGYLADLAVYLRDEQNRLTANVSDMIERVDHIRDVIMLQQSHSKVHTLWEPLDLATVMEDALRLETSVNGGHQFFTVERQYADLPPVYLARGLLLQVLVNLLSNANHAMEEAPEEQRKLTLRIGPNGADGVRLSVEDNGCGIPAHHLEKVFTQGFTTKREGHGFGLHHASLLVDDLGGNLRAESEGLGKGARFILDLPARKAPAAAAESSAPAEAPATPAAPTPEETSPAA